MVWFWMLVVFRCGRLAIWNIHMIWVLSFYDYFYCGFLTKHGNGDVPDALLTYTSPNWLCTVHQGSEGSQKTGITQVKPSGFAFNLGGDGWYSVSPAVGLYAIPSMWLSWANNNMPSHFLKKTSIPTHQGVVWMEGGVERKGEIGFNEVLMFFF